MLLNFIIIVITILVSISAWNQADLFAKLRFNPTLIKERKEYWRAFSYGLIHADWIHLGINMFVLYSFGSVVIQYFSLVFPGSGIAFYLLLYVGGLAVSVVPAYIKHKNNPYYNAVGASGAVSAVLFSSIVFDPMNEIYLFPIPFGVPAVVFGILYIAYSAYMNKKANDNVGHDAHLWGGVYGFLLTMALKPSLIGHFFNQIFG
ncbi:MAG: rhomboid family intramembrane serine protease [Bacteroidetes bacterium 4572_77]|nr:MAG: rhomboid family intramembrane serine protease [Bacteroidetes bacterium 4572_77]